jgi:hypothetical protein
MYIAGVLASLCDTHLQLPCSDMIVDLHPDNGWKYGLKPEDDYWTKVVKILISKIRLSSIEKFPGYTKPLRFRNMVDKWGKI